MDNSVLAWVIWTVLISGERGSKVSPTSLINEGLAIVWAEKSTTILDVIWKWFDKKKKPSILFEREWRFTDVASLNNKW